MTAVRLDAPVVVLTGRDIDTVRLALDSAIRSSGRNGHSTKALTRVYRKVAGHSDYPQHGTDAHSNRVPITEAARLLGVSERQARRLAHRLDGQKAGGRWTVDYLALIELLDERNHDAD